MILDFNKKLKDKNDKILDFAASEVMLEKALKCLTLCKGDEVDTIKRNIIESIKRLKIKNGNITQKGIIK